MTKVVSFKLEAALVEGVLSQGTRRVRCLEVQDAAPILAAGPPPHLVVLSGNAGCAADFAQGLLDDPKGDGLPSVAWRIDGNLADRSRLVALGVVVADGDEDALREACDAALDARDGRTLRVDAQASVQDSTAAHVLALYGRRVIVADDDPAITWFFADLLRAQGCDVDEACDGAAALDRARRTMPDLVVSDIRMPRLDGLRLCQALRADPLLADAPIVLLSWKQDWLLAAQRDSARASAYLAKRSTPEEVLVRVLEVLAPHARFERRMRQPGQVQADLGSAAPYRLLRLACATHADSRLTVRCDARAYEIQIRGGTPRRALCVPIEGRVVRAASALALLLQERSGRFTLTPDSSEVDDELLGGLHQQIAPHVARVRRSITALPVETLAPAPTVPAAAAALVVYPQAVPTSCEARNTPGPVERVPRTGEWATRTTPMVLQPSPTVRPVAEKTAQLRKTRLAAPTRSRANLLRWIGVAAVAVLGVVLGASARVLGRAPHTDARAQTR